MPLLAIGAILLVIFLLVMRFQPRHPSCGMLILGAIASMGLGIAHLLFGTTGLRDCLSCLSCTLTPIALSVLALFTLTNAITAIIRRRRRARAPLSIAGSALIVILAWTTPLTWGHVTTGASIGHISLTTAAATAVWLCQISLAATFAAFALHSLAYALLPKPARSDYLIVLGAGLHDGVHPSRTLRGRLLRGIELWEQGGRRATFIVSGGRGPDEAVTEASAMRAYLLARRVPEENVVTEEQATSTVENALFSKKLIDKMGKGECEKDNRRAPTNIVVTSNFHVLRAGFCTLKAGLDAIGIGSPTLWYYWPGQFARELFASIVMNPWWLAILPAYCLIVLTLTLSGCGS